MKNKLLKYLIFVFVISIVLLFTACSDNNPRNKDSTISDSLSDDNQVELVTSNDCSEFDGDVNQANFENNSKLETNKIKEIKIIENNSQNNSWLLFLMVFVILIICLWNANLTLQLNNRLIRLSKSNEGSNESSNENQRAQQNATSANQSPLEPDDQQQNKVSSDVAKSADNKELKSVEKNQPEPPIDIKTKDNRDQKELEPVNVPKVPKKLYAPVSGNSFLISQPNFVKNETHYSIEVDPSGTKAKYSLILEDDRMRSYAIRYISERFFCNVEVENSKLSTECTNLRELAAGELMLVEDNKWKITSFLKVIKE